MVHIETVIENTPKVQISPEPQVFDAGHTRAVVPGKALARQSKASLPLPHVEKKYTRVGAGRGGLGESK